MLGARRNVVCSSPRFWALLLSSCCLVRLLDAQGGSPQPAAQLIPDLASCQRCQIIVRERALTIGADSGLAEIPSSIGWDARGRVYFTQPKRGTPIVYEPDSRRMVTLGRAGSGPGEFRMAAVVEIIPGDTVIIFDRGNARLTVLGPSYRFARSAPAPFGTQAMRWWPGPSALVVNALVRDRERVGRPFHLFDRVGNELRSLGEGGNVLFGDVGASLMRAMTVDRSGNLVAVTALGRYEVEVWSADGRLVRRFRREPKDFKYPPAPTSNPTRSSDLPPPDPWISAAWVDSTGLLWTAAVVPDKTWRAGVKLDKVGHGTEVGWQIDVVDPTRYADTIIEVLDLKSGRLVARTRLDQPCRSFSPAGALACEAANDDGTFRVDVFPVAIAGQLSR